MMITNISVYKLNELRIVIPKFKSRKQWGMTWCRVLEESMSDEYNLSIVSLIVKKKTSYVMSSTRSIRLLDFQRLLSIPFVLTKNEDSAVITWSG